MSISNTTILKSDPGAQVILFAGTLAVKHLHTTVYLPLDTLPIFDLFRTPTSLGDAMQRLQPRFSTKEDWLRLTNTIISLYQSGLLIAIDERPEIDVSLPQTTISLHMLLLYDRFRTSHFLESLRQVVQPTDIVLDIGTGSGVLAAGAALAGAKHVYAIEQDPIAKIARKVFEHNGLADRITVVEGLSTQIELPERADVLVSEIISNGVFGQSLIDTTRDATRRLLKPDARLIPNRVRMYGQLVEVDANWLARQHFTGDTIAAFKEYYGIDFSPFLTAQPPLLVINLMDFPAMQKWTYLSDPVLLADIDLANLQDDPIESSPMAVVTRQGTLSGVVIYFEADLAPQNVLTTRPTVSDRSHSWSNPVWLCEPSLVDEGMSVRLHLHTSSNPDTYFVEIAPVTEQ